VYDEAAVPVLDPPLAIVRPRVVSPETGETILLEDAVADALSDPGCGIIQILGGPGSGKSFALEYLRASLAPDRGLTFADTKPEVDAVATVTYEASAGLESAPPPEAPASSSAIDLPDAATRPPTADPDRPVVHRFRLARWGDDEFIEYLLAAHRGSCASVMGRLRASGDRPLLAGIPELCRPVLDQLARDESITSALEALRRALRTRLKHGPARWQLARYALACLQDPPPLSRELNALRDEVGRAGCDPAALRLARHEAVRVLLAGELVLARVKAGRATALAQRLPPHVVKEVARRCDERAVERLEQVVHSTSRDSHPTAASLLVARDPTWRWKGPKPPNLRNASLDGVQWSGIHLVQGELTGASLAGADLAGALLDKLYANSADFSGACLNGASLTECTALAARFRGASLRRARAGSAHFGGADFEEAVCDGALLQSASLFGANLTSASLRDVSLCRATLLGATLTDADLAGADLTGAVLAGLDLRETVLMGAILRQADLTGSDLEYLALPNANFEQAALNRALLTGTAMPSANFRGASLRESGLAEVEWEAADLRDADLRGATFHLGSSRSGLVFSPFVSEGTRTGFYTDESDQHLYRPPEEIRKANLRRADLRGARVDETDFYLVDLRDALHTPGQRAHFMACGAILAG
jgi:uncharacterized protein YjbI with pentapeptide repeats